MYALRMKNWQNILILNLTEIRQFKKTQTLNHRSGLPDLWFKHTRDKRIQEGGTWYPTISPPSLTSQEIEIFSPNNMISILNPIKKTLTMTRYGPVVVGLP